MFKQTLFHHLADTAALLEFNKLCIYQCLSVPFKWDQGLVASIHFPNPWWTALGGSALDDASGSEGHTGTIEPVESKGTVPKCAKVIDIDGPTLAPGAGVRPSPA